jgi:hypothetical protein
MAKKKVLLTGASWFIKEIMKGIAMKRDGTLHWVENNNEGRVSAFFGARDCWETLPDWTQEPRESFPDAIRLDHGYEERSDDDYSIAEMREAAAFRGGACLSDAFVDMRTKLKWRCAFAHTFDATPTLVLEAGQWCPVCAPPPWNRARIARHNPFYAQVYDKPFHRREEDRYFDEKCYEEILSV